MQTEFSNVTELPGNQVSKEQIERIYQRYYFASKICTGKDVLEVACGSGLGLGILANSAKKTMAGDIDENILNYARKQYNGRKNIALQVIDAHKLPFPDKSLDVVILYEAVYYLSNIEKFIDETKRVLRDNGVLIIGTVNKDWSDFNPSPFSVKYYSVPEIYRSLKSKFSDIQFYGGFPVTTETSKDKIISLIKRIAVRLHLIPKTMKSKEYFKRIFFGKLTELPGEIIEGCCAYQEPELISCDVIDNTHKIIYVIGKK